LLCEQKWREDYTYEQQGDKMELLETDVLIPGDVPDNTG